MIFVTVGTHEQQFNRLIEYIDMWAKKQIEDVVMQIGYSSYEPQYSSWQRFFSYQEMLNNINDARIVITHGGPSSFVMPLQIGKIPIVVPRRKEYGEHVNNHQLEFSIEVSKRLNNIILIDDISQLENTIKRYEEIVEEKKNTIESNNKRFVEKFATIIEAMI